MKVEVYIEGNKLDLFDDEQITVRSSVQDVNDISKLFADFSQSFTVPANDNNNGVFSHWYNSDVDNGFDARTRVQSTIDVGTLDFKRGKMRLDKAEIKNGQPANYRITFFGDVIKIKDLLGDDTLQDLSWLANFNHSYTASNVRTGLIDGIDFSVDSVSYTAGVIYPLISYNRQYEYDSSTGNNTSTDVLVNISHKNNRDTGVEYTELKPAIKLLILVEAIQQKYGLTFTGDFFNSSEFTNIYMSLNNSTESLANGLKVYETISGSLGSIGDAVVYSTTVTPNTGNLDYKIRLTINGIVEHESVNWIANTQTVEATQIKSVTFGTAYSVKAEVITKEAFVFNATTTLSVSASGVETVVSGFPNSYTIQTIVLTTTITNEIPDMKSYDFLTSLFKMFNLVIVPDGEDIQIEDLQSWYSAGAIHDITKYIDTESETISRGKIHTEINFKFKESDQILADEFEQNNRQVYGDLEFKLVDSAGADVTDVDGDTLDIEVEFENPLYERLFDLNSNNITSIQYCPYFDRNIKPITGNPFLFYAPSVSVVSNPIGFVGSTYEKLEGNIFMPSHSIQIDTASFNLNFNTEINEYTFNKFENTIFFKYYQDYITDIFSVKRRIHNFKAILPNSLLNTLKLNDRLVIKDKRYIINSINSNLVIRGDELELINDIYDAPLASDLLSASLFVPSSQVYNSEARSATAKYIGLSGKSIGKVSTGDGTAFLTVVQSSTTSTVFTINFSILINTTGDTRSVQIQVTDGLNDPKFTIIQTTVFNPSFDFSDFRNTQMLATIFIRA